MTYADRIPAPRPIPNMSARLTDARACGHTPEQHRHDDGQDADAASHDRAIRELEAELAAARGPRPELTELLDRMTADRDTTQQVATFRQGVIDRHRQELGAAGEVLAVVRDAHERIERALARYDTQPGQPEPEAEPRHPGDALADALRNAYTPGQLAILHERTVDQLDDDAPREDPLGRLVDALFAAAHQKPSAGLGSPSPRAQDEPESDARRLLDQAIAVALPLAGGRVGELLDVLRRELVRVDAKRAEKTEG